MLHSRATLYFDEVARRGSIRRASEHLNVAASAVDRQILHLEREVGTPLFERSQRGLRLTAAGELLVDALRRWRRELARVRSHIDDLQGLRQGEVSVAIVEGAAELLSDALHRFRVLHPGISYRVRVTNAHDASELVLSNAFDLGIAFALPDTHALRLEKSLFYRIGALVSRHHPLADRKELTLYDCDEWPLIIPDHTLSLRTLIDACWAKCVGHPVRPAFEVNSIALIKSLAKRGAGVAVLTPIDARDDIASGEMVLIPFSGDKIPEGVLSLVTASSRSLSVPANLFIAHLTTMMMNEQASVI